MNYPTTDTWNTANSALFQSLIPQDPAAAQRMQVLNAQLAQLQNSQQVQQFQTDWANNNPSAQIPTSVLTNTVQNQASNPAAQATVPQSVQGTFQTQGNLIGQQAIAAEDTSGTTPNWMKGVNATTQQATVPSWKKLFG